MKRLYEKSELGFALVWIGAYVVLMSLADTVSGMLGIEKVLTAPVCVLMTAALVCWICANGQCGKYGLAKVSLSWKKYLFFLPLVLMVSVNLWNGFQCSSGILETVLYVVSMLAVGVLEELIFRGLLFKALCKESITLAVVISSVTFGVGHIVNLLNGAQILPTILQIIYATAAGFLFTVIFLRSGSLWPCIIAHSVLNSLSIFAGEQTLTQTFLAAAVLTMVPMMYAAWIWKVTETNE